MSFSIQNYTMYSVLSGLLDPKAWVTRAKELGYPALGICDKSTMGGVLDFQDECLKAGIKPIFGIEVPLAKEIVKEKSTRENMSHDGNILLYAMNEVGYKNLVKLNNRSQDRSGTNPNFYYFARLDYEFLSENSEGIICVLPEFTGYGVNNKDNEVKVPLIMELKDIFEDNFYVALEETDNGNQTSVLRSLCESVQLKTIPSFAAHYPREEQYYLQKIVREIDRGRNISSNVDRNVEGCYLRPMERNKNLQEIYNKVDYVIPTGETHMPEPVIRTESVKQDLIQRIGEGFKKKLNPNAGFDILTSLDQLDEWCDGYPFEHIQKGELEETLKPLSEYVERIKYEWKIIEDLGYLAYFHIVDDVCGKADERNYPRGPGRGSAAGSEFSYLLNITHVDPLRHDLFFERFLNPDRNDLPDIDLDFGQDARTKIVEWVAERYGKTRTVFIGSYDRLKAASTVKYLSKIMGYSIPANNGERVQYDDRVIESLFKKADKHVPETVRGRAEMEYMAENYEEVGEFYHAHSDWFETHVFPLLETITATSVHAAGVLILPEDYESLMPVFSHSTKDLVITQFRDKYCERLGYPKFDFLTVQAIDVICNARDMIRKHKDPNFPDIHEVSLSDEKAMQVFKDGKTEGIFQLGSKPQQYYAPKLKPTRFEHLFAAVALMRPGPMGMDIHLHYAQALNGETEIIYAHEDLEPSLGSTYGFIVYQEQMMRITQDIAGFTGSEADHVRKACGKKKPEEMAKWSERFKEQGVKRGYTQELVDDLWDIIVSFAEYSFNKSHSVSYTLISYYEGYIKAHYPLEFWCAVMNTAKKSSAGGKDSIHSLKGSIERMGIEFVYPSVSGFSVEFAPAGENQIYWPLSVLKGFGATKVEYLESLDKECFSSLETMLDSVNTGIISKRVVENMIRAGFFTPLEPQWVTAKKYYTWRAKQAQAKPKKPKELQYYYDKEKIPSDMLSEDSLDWAKSRNEAYGSTMESWKDVANFHHKVKRYTKKQYESREKGVRLFIGGRVDRIFYKKTKRGGWFVTMFITDGDEKYTVRGWDTFWESRELDIKGNRPEKGDLVELIGEKDIWTPEPGKNIHSISLNDPSQYVRIVNRAFAA